MCRKTSVLICLFSVAWMAVKAQELQARFSINSARVSGQSDKKAMQTLQAAVTTFLNNRKWTNDTYQVNEKVVCNFTMNIIEVLGSNNYKATLSVQAARPVYNTSYETPLINFLDDAVVFHYVEFQAIEFNENRVSGTDPLTSNLTATLAYYVYLILGLDGDSFALRGGDPHFQKCQNIVNNAPEGRDISGWKAFDGLRSRYWLMENLTNNRYNQVHDAIYSYYRLGMDFMYENETEARNAVMNALNLLNTINNDIPNSMIIQFFFQGKSSELIRVFKKATPDDKQRAREILSKVDVSNSNAYKNELK